MGPSNPYSSAIPVVLLIQPFAVPPRCFVLFFFNGIAEARCWGRSCSCRQPVLLLCWYQCELGVVVGSNPIISSSAGLGLATKLRGAFSSLHQLNGSGVGAGIRAGPAQSEVRNGTVLFGGSDALA